MFAQLISARYNNSNHPTIKMALNYAPVPEINIRQAKICPKHYQEISYQLRKSLIQLVQQNGISVYSACQMLKIKHTTAKAIVRKYRKEGTIFKRKASSKNVRVRQNRPSQLQNQRIQQENQRKQINASENSPVSRNQSSLANMNPSIQNTLNLGSFAFFPIYQPFMLPYNAPFILQQDF